MLNLIYNENVKEITGMENHELHVMVGDSDGGSDVYALINGLGLSKTNITGKHERLCDGDLFSLYSHNKKCTMEIYENFKSFMDENQNIPLLIENESVAHQVQIAAQREFSAGSWLEFSGLLSRFGKLPEKNGSHKRADIHLSLPSRNLSAELESALAEKDVTFLRVSRTGEEDIPGGCGKGDEWISYTMQFADKYGAKNAEFFYKTLAACLPNIGGYNGLAILKLEIVTSFYITSSHPGVPAIESKEIAVH